jgi:hypothetical protein
MSRDMVTIDVGSCSSVFAYIYFLRVSMTVAAKSVTTNNKDAAMGSATVGCALALDNGDPEPVGIGDGLMLPVGVVSS